MNPYLTRRGALGLGAGAGTAILLSACGDSGPNEKVTGGGPNAAPAATAYTGPNVSLAFWNGFTGGDGAFMKTLIDQFNTEHQNIKVSMNVYQWADYYQKVPAAVSSGNGPDLGIMHVDSVATNAARGVILPLDDLAASLSLTEDDFSPPVWQAGVYNQKRYGIPLDVHPLGLFYNKTVMEKAGLDPEKPPATADEYLTALDKLKSAGVQGSWATPFQFTGSMWFHSLLWQFGGDLFDAGAQKATFAQDPGVQALTWYTDLVRKGYSPRNVAQDADLVALRNGKNALNWNGIWTINTLSEDKNLQWGAAPVPQIGTQKAVWAGSHQFVQFKQRSQDDNKLTAGKVFINWISQKSLEWAKGGQVPARKDVRESAEFKALPAQAALAQQIDYVHYPPSVPGIGDALNTVVTAVNESVLLRKEPAKALSDAAAKADQILEQNRKKYGG
ncbi:putative ABC transporter substrate-binding protein [Actinoplanes missouriensis 431]|uniref:Putative ABC transporter substrate-binding protein n=1 Tax=Actinoplanes missouriensis (strain ATCC 14538 / DSM 43046 / CBS 188.64 / JCM 3121 / NBRC 102363 / NCIMB 12654 / NRRL B-3342 / UNCC 431) TaxID=512565 RepID=I0H9F3_ACTM4|nr:ABC transporter substrate-binding protein [Actinoplanes missouriensis]BAL89640.1 putative ABC transporter substrate-binding protein [Actinoplanes missouriensis 431]